MGEWAYTAGALVHREAGTIECARGREGGPDRIRHADCGQLVERAQLGVGAWEATASGKEATRTALGALGDGGLVESQMLPRVDSWHRLLPPAFGHDGEVAEPGR